MTNRRQMVQGLAAGAASSLAARSVWSQDDRSPITLLVMAGTTMEYTARLIADQLREVLGRPVVVVLKQGAGGRVAVSEVMRSAPDGRTLLFSTSSPFAIYPNIYRKLDYDPVQDFTVIGRVCWFDVAVATSLDSGLKDMPSLLAWAKARGKDAMYGTAPGGGSSSHFAGIAITQAAGAPMTFVPYRAANDALVDLATGRIPVLITGTGALVEMHKAGRFRVVAVSGEQRSSLVPEASTLQEAGVAVTFQISAGLFGPARMPRELVDRIYGAMLPMLDKPDVRAKMATQGMAPAPMTGPELSAWIERERNRIDGLARAVGYQKEDA